MTDRAALLQLRDRLAKATGPDRELDLALLNAIDPSPNEWLWKAGYPDTISRLDYGHGAPGNPVCSLDPYTASRDAAATLEVPGLAEVVVRVFPNGVYVRWSFEGGAVYGCGADDDLAKSEPLGRCIVRLNYEIARAA